MDNGGKVVVFALVLILVFEGAVYALFPDGMKKMMAAMQEIPASTLRAGGLAAMVTGLVIFWLTRISGF